MANIFDLFKQISSGESAKSLPVEYIVVGLGNPGRDYENTRHNAGFLTIDHIAEKCGVKIDRARFKALTASASIGGKGVLLMKPQTFMNLSGDAVGEAARFYKVQPENIIVISDDLNLDVGRLRIRKSGSAGGQKGLNDIIEKLGTENIPRVRVGVGKKPHPDFDIKDWVLSNFTKEENAVLKALYDKAYLGVEKIVAGDVDAAMQICNGK
ncbi:MAG: aminoacyl-tRNA hydrolase [Ruminococcaceae bacterium]|nr:aminoacyl-tRNA hydrolase [Oscillospiraceae bacterium]